MFGRQPPTGRRPAAQLQALVHAGKPTKAHPSVHLEQPMPVLVDLGVLFPRPVFYGEPPRPGGLRLRRVVEGRLTIWALSEEGDWFGLVAYDVRGADDGGLPQRVSHWIPGHLLRRRDP